MPRWRWSLAITAGAIALGSGLGAPALANNRFGDTIYVNTPEGYALNVRWGPSTSNGIYRQVRRGSALQVSGARHNGWVQLIDATWVAGNLVSSTEVIGDPPPDTRNRATVITPQYFALNIRSGPGFDFPVVGQFLNGSRIALTGRFCNGWAQLLDDDEDEWVDRLPIQYSGPIPSDSCPGPIADESVRELQRLLIQVGYLPPSFVITGINDQTTQNAVRRFQWDTGLPVTGDANRATLDALYRATAPIPDENVRELQRLLIQVGYLPPSFVISGIYDQTTQNAVRQFQQDNGLPVTGNVNQATWDALYLAAGQQSPSPEPDPDPPPVGSRQMRVVTDGDATSVFDGPGTEFGFLRDVANGSIVTVTGQESGNWSELSDGGWIFSLWLDEM